MARPDDIQDKELRDLVQSGYDCMRNRKATEAVKALSDAFLHLLELRPELIHKKIEFRIGREMPFLMRWPALGANLKPGSVRAGKPEIEFLRERFAISEAMTYYHFVLETAIDEGA